MSPQPGLRDAGGQRNLGTFPGHCSSSRDDVRLPHKEEGPNTCGLQEVRCVVHIPGKSGLPVCPGRPLTRSRSGTGCGHPEASIRSGLGNSLARRLGTRWDPCPVLEIGLGHSEFPWGWGRKRGKRGPAIVTQSPGGSGGPSLERRRGAGENTARVAASSGRKWPWRLSVPCPHPNS